jgi:hypothetical protein
MTIEIRPAQNTDAKEWDAIVSKSPQGTIFHQWDWLKITEKHTDYQLYPLFGIKNEEIIGIFPLFYQRKGPIRMVFSPPPHASIFYLGPVLAGNTSLKQEKWEIMYFDFQSSVENFINNYLKSNYTYISLSPALQDPRPFIWSGYIFDSHFDYVVDISHGCDHLLQSLDKKVRQNLNRSKKRGMTVEIGGQKEYEIILDMMDIRYAEQGKTVTESRDYFRDIFNVYQETMKIFVVKYEGEVVTGSIDLQYKDTHYSWIGSPKPKNRISPSPNDLLMWESVRYACEQGFRYYVTMNAAGNKRLHSYYASKFDPELRAHFSVKRHSYIVQILEKIHLNVTKPLNVGIKNCKILERGHNTTDLMYNCPE